MIRTNDNGTASVEMKGSTMFSETKMHAKLPPKKYRGRKRENNVSNCTLSQHKVACPKHTA